MTRRAAGGGPASAFTRDQLIDALGGHIGCDRGATAQELVAEILGYGERNLAAERRVRRLVEALRRDGHHVCATPENGYYMAATPEELDRTCLFLYDRAMTTLQQVSRMRGVSLPDLKGQLRLPT